jgi:RNA polymerase sigma-70 factor (ECF subfamily)
LNPSHDGTIAVSITWTIPQAMNDIDRRSLHGGSNEPAQTAVWFHDHVTPLRGWLVGIAIRRYQVQAADAEDLAQDTLIRAWQARESFEQGTNLKAWLAKILYRLVLNRWRKAKREVPVAETFPRDTTPSAEELYEAGNGEAMAALTRLKEPFRSAVALVLVGDRSYRQMADELGVAFGTAQSRYGRGVRKLRELVAAQSQADLPKPAGLTQPAGLRQAAPRTGRTDARPDRRAR